jgi:preprotein translocase subunit SecG
LLAYFLYGLFFVSCLTLILTVLLQPGKTDAGALFTSNISSTAFGPRGTQSVLSRITIGAAITFMLSALLLSFPAIVGNISVLQTTSETATETKPATTDANSANVSNANIVVTNSNTAIVVPAANTNVNK